MRFPGFFITLLLCIAPVCVRAAERQLICCGAETVFIVPLVEGGTMTGEPIWSWQAKDSPEIPDSMRGQFRTTDECKPVGDDVLVTSSSGGVALVRRNDKKCLFLASVRNAHSACLLPENRIAVAASTGGDAVQVFDRAKGGPQAKATAQLPLEGAHGVVWDADQKRLWALGTHELLRIDLRELAGTLELAIDDRWTLPTRGGHDLLSARDPRVLFVTTNSAVYQFDRQSHKFQPFTPLADHAEVKSIDEHPATGQIVYHKADTAAKTWWSDTIRFLNPEGAIVLPQRLYKVRWDRQSETADRN
jgi:hypothetical protein